MGGEIIQVEGYEACLAKLEELKGTENLFLLFSGSKDGESGQSWCPHCVRAEPVIERCFSNVSKKAILLYVGVGQRDYWKDQNNPFRTNDKLRLTAVPTLMKWEGAQKLKGEECAKE